MFAGDQALGRVMGPDLEARQLAAGRSDYGPTTTQLSPRALIWAHSAFASVRSLAGPT